MQEQLSELRRNIILLFILCVVFFSACTGPTKGNRDGKRPPFLPIAGIDFYEARRSFDNGLSFDTIGFQQEPIWMLRFINNDTVSIYSPTLNMMGEYPIYYDHDSIFNFGTEWFRVKSLDKDSMLFQRLSVKGLRVKESLSNVYMKFYSESFIRDSLKTTVEELRKPNRADSVFIRSRVERANRNPLIIDSVFSARDGVQLRSINQNLSVSRYEYDPGEAIGKSLAYRYLYPEFDIEINKAYKDFYYSFSVLVDQYGKMSVGKFITSPEFEESRERVLQGIIDVYLQNWMEIKPGTTLGMPHSTLIMLHVKGVQ
ncbi:hypothetical protein [Albibacterium sp.]|uniref:hypothetical protein n=1 Tax=Albibacterium sp. TaxID=2952885 RepID=UPI002C5C869B|nr:hypothetical protein [Albibacterium sp.]HUH19115.1 hypothetical protein [Albibacterium sp.]